jgi:3-deoxy-D-manno-octulosonate 8-phosphate phosphatase (KDO 8-P phosphatase)
MFKLLILDIDGVMTDGTKLYDTEGKVIAKSFYDHDFTAIKRFIKERVSVCFLSGDERVNRPMSKNRNIDYYHNTRDKDKSEYIEQICKDYNCTLEETAFVGDDIYDLGIMDLIAYPFCPSDAVKDVLDFCNLNGHVLQSQSGKGAIKELYTYVYQ